ncbi:MAG: metal ABC transporter permease [Actinobacteria bacterium]|nr:metal ABC transporter permease [Actinomycetota bacterium]MDA2951819.1 metal ABC transporter permease [Actinomycetota bacterium]MDA2998858.1 metal ABC transporter permease [Actinomycetota bacterium]
MTLAIDLLEPYTFQFFRNGVVVATIAGALCGLLGVFVVLRGMSYIGHGLSHAVFGGAAASAVIGINFFIGAGIWGIVSGVLIARVARRRVLGADAAIGVVTTASFALGLALMNRYGQASKSIEAVLFGSVLGVKTSDIFAVGAVALFALAVVVVWYRKLLFSTFDPDVAQVSGVNVSVVEMVLLSLLSLTILVTMRVIGTLLISALLVIPAASARMTTNSFSRLLWISPAIGAVTCFAGMNLSYHLDTSASATIILLDALIFVVVYTIAGTRNRMKMASLGHV